MDPRVNHKDLLFNGKLMTGEPAAIGTNFRTLKNMRYTDTHIKGVGGMTEINTSALTTYLKVRSAFHLNKSQPAESHVVVEAWETTVGVGAQIKENKTEIPTVGSFSATILMTASTVVQGAGIGRFSEAPDGQLIYANGVDTCIWGGDELKIGALITTKVEMTASTDTPSDPVDYTEEVNNTKSDALNVFTCGGSYKSFLVGSPRPLSGVKIYISSPNVTPNTLTIKESTTGAWNALTILTDTNQSPAGTRLGQTGSITWASTVNTTKPRYIEGYYLYWYEFTINGGTADIYQISLNAPFQSIIDMWDGVYRDISRFYVYTTTQLDNSVNVFRDDYDVSSPYTYSDISSLVATNQYLEIGFTEKQTALYFQIPPGYENSTAATVASVDFWDGDSYATVGDIIDGTSSGAISVAKSGVVSWVNANIASEQRKQYANSIPLYYYRVKFDQTLDAAVRLNYVGGITASNSINHYKFPVFAQGRVLLCCDMSGDKNKALVSAKYMPQVYNGEDSIDIYFGEEGELTCGTGLFSQFGSSLYSLILIFKKNETWIVAGQDIDQWENNIFMISSSIGCPCPLTLQTINLSQEPSVGLNRALAIWRGANGIYMSDGRAPIPVHNDIKEYFDPLDSKYITISSSEVAFVDPVRQEYHWLTGTLELVYDIVHNKWFEIDRGVDLKCGLVVHGTNGNAYNYGFLDTGYMEYLENGTDFDGTDITHTVQFGDVPLAGSAVETRVSNVRLITVAKTVTGNDITLTHYGDSNATGTDKTLDPTNTGYRIAKPNFVEKFDGIFHSFKLVQVTDDETIGFEPLNLAVSFHPVHEDT